MNHHTAQYIEYHMEYEDTLVQPKVSTRHRSKINLNAFSASRVHVSTFPRPLLHPLNPR